MPGNERMFMINGAASWVQVQGGAGGPAVLLVGSSMLSWPDELCQRLVAGGRRVIRYDVRDTGRSESYPPGEPGYCLADLVEDAVGVLDATATERAHVVGAEQLPSLPVVERNVQEPLVALTLCQLRRASSVPDRFAYPPHRPTVGRMALGLPTDPTQL